MIAFASRLCLLLCCLLSLVRSIAQSPPVLPAGQTIRRTMHKGTEIQFQVQLDSGTTYLLHGEQKGIDVALVLTDANGDTVGYQDSPNGMFGGETLVVTPAVSGRY